MSECAFIEEKQKLYGNGTRPTHPGFEAGTLIWISVPDLRYTHSPMHSHTHANTHWTAKSLDILDILYVWVVDAYIGFVFFLVCVRAITYFLFISGEKQQYGANEELWAFELGCLVFVWFNSEIEEEVEEDVGLITGNSHLSNIFIFVGVVDDGDGVIVDAGLKLTFWMSSNKNNPLVMQLLAKCCAAGFVFGCCGGWLFWDCFAIASKIVAIYSIRDHSSSQIYSPPICLCCARCTLGHCRASIQFCSVTHMYLLVRVYALYPNWLWPNYLFVWQILQPINSYISESAMTTAIEFSWCMWGSSITRDFVKIVI